MNTLIKKSHLFPSFPGFFDDFFTKDIFDWNDKNFAKNGTSFPAVNMKENDKEYIISLAAPGMKKEDFTVEFHGGILTMKAEKKSENVDEDANGKFIRREYTYESFIRSVPLPDDAKDDDANASYHNGILNIVITKKIPTAVIAPKAISVK